jgi:Zn-finger nucleic acid-binding protein
LHSFDGILIVRFKACIKILLFCSISFICLSSCSGWFGTDKDKFVDTYKDILIARETIPDSTNYEKEYQKILEKHGYNTKSFQEDYYKLSKKPDQLLALMDTARNRAKNEILLKKPYKQ